MTINAKKFLGPGVSFGSSIGVFQASGYQIVDSIQYPSTDIKSIIAGPYNVVNLNSFNFNIISHRTATITSYVGGEQLVGSSRNAEPERTNTYIGQKEGYGSYIYGNLQRPAVAGDTDPELSLARFDCAWDFSTGNLVWSRMIYDPNMRNAGDASPFWTGGVPQSFYDGSNDVFSYVSTIQYNPASGGTRSRIMKTRADNGQVLWARTLYHVSTSTGNYNFVTQDSLGNVYACGDVANSFIPLSIVKFNSSGTVQWRFGLGRTGMEDYRFMSIIAGSDGLYALVGTPISGTTYSSSPPYLLKIDYTNCSIIWQRKLKSSIPIWYDIDAGVRGAGSKMSLDSAGNLYLAISTNTNTQGSGAYNILLYKFSPSGTQLFNSKTIPGFLADMKVVSGFINILFRSVAFDYTNPLANNDLTNSCLLKVPVDGSKATGDYLIPTTTGKFAKVSYTNNNDTFLGFTDTSPGVDNISALSTTSIIIFTTDGGLLLNNDYPRVRLANSTPSAYAAYKITI